MSSMASFGQNPDSTRKSFPISSASSGYSRNPFAISSDKFQLIKDTVDMKSFQEIGKRYAKDENHVYFNYVRDIGGSRAHIVEKYYLIEGADPKTFEVMENSIFSHDENHVYYAGFLIEGADVKSFQPLNSRYSKDDKHVFFEKSIIDGADLSSFITVGNGWCAYDNNFLYFYYSKEKIDMETFVPSGFSNVYKDKNYIYYLRQDSGNYIKKEINWKSDNP